MNSNTDIVKLEKSIIDWSKNILLADYGLIHFRIYLFGSFAKGTANEKSDIDVAIECIQIKDGYTFDRAIVLLRHDAHLELNPKLGKIVNIEEYDKKYVEAKLLYDSQIN